MSKRGDWTPLPTMYILFIIRTKALILAKKIKNKQREQSQSCSHTEHKNKMSRLFILKIKRTKERSLDVT